MCLRFVFLVAVFFLVCCNTLEITHNIRRTDSVPLGLGDVVMRSFQDSVKSGYSDKDRRANVVLIRMLRRNMQQDEWVYDDAYKRNQVEGGGAHEHETENGPDGGEADYERGSEHDRGEAPALGSGND